MVSSDSVFPFIPESSEGEKHNNQNLKSTTDDLVNQDKSLWAEDGAVCSFCYLDFGHRSQI